MDVLSVSWKQPADLSPWYGVFHEQGSLLQILIGALIEYWMFRVYNADLAPRQNKWITVGLTPTLEFDPFRPELKFGASAVMW
jgi:hypothetical protein